MWASRISVHLKCPRSCSRVLAVPLSPSPAKILSTLHFRSFPLSPSTCFLILLPLLFSCLVSGQISCSELSESLLSRMAKRGLRLATCNNGVYSLGTFTDKHAPPLVAYFYPTEPTQQITDCAKIRWHHTLAIISLKNKRVHFVFGGLCVVLQKQSGCASTL